MAPHATAGTDDVEDVDDDHSVLGPVPWEIGYVCDVGDTPALECDGEVIPFAYRAVWKVDGQRAIVHIGDKVEFQRKMKRMPGGGQLATGKAWKVRYPRISTPKDKDQATLVSGVLQELLGSLAQNSSTSCPAPQAPESWCGGGPPQVSVPLRAQLADLPVAQSAPVVMASSVPTAQPAVPPASAPTVRPAVHVPVASVASISMPASFPVVPRMVPTAMPSGTYAGAPRAQVPLQRFVACGSQPAHQPVTVMASIPVALPARC